MVIGMPLSVVTATLFFTLKEVKYLLLLFTKWIMNYGRFINDGLVL
jgi:hypothetical protein